MEEKITRSQSQYSMKIPRLHPNSKYECIAKVKNLNGTSEKSEATVFETLQDCETFCLHFNEFII